jgi:hypothetical protein
MTSQQFADKYFGPHATAAPFLTSATVNWTGDPGSVTNGAPVSNPISPTLCATSQAAADLMGVIRGARNEALAALMDPNSSPGARASAMKILPVAFTQTLVQGPPLSNFVGGMYSQNMQVPWFKCAGMNAAGQPAVMMENAGMCITWFSHGMTGLDALAGLFLAIDVDLQTADPVE